MTLEAGACSRGETPACLVGSRHTSPFDVVRDPSLDTAEKREILADWASDARALPSLPTYRQLDDGTLVLVGDIMGALNALDVAAEPAWPVRRSLKAANARWVKRLLRRDRDDDDDPPPIPACMPPPRPRDSGADAVSLCAA